MIDGEINKSEMLGFVSNPLERNEDRKNEKVLLEKLVDKSSKLLLLKNLDPLIENEKLKYESFQEEFKGLKYAYLGKYKDIYYFTIDVSSIEYSGTFINAFEALKFLSDEDLSILAQARTIIDWLNNTIYCSKCASKMDTSIDGYLKTCSKDKIRLYPRMNPVAIMLVYNKDNTKILLGSNQKYKGIFFSCLSGFLDSSETPEDAVIRETFEEAGIIIDRSSIQYVASQPWPFQQNNNLMLGFTARALSDDIKIDEKEMSAVKWFSANEVLDIMNNKTDMRLPGKVRYLFFLH